MRKLSTMLLLLVLFIASYGQEQIQKENRADSVEIIDRKLDDTAPGVVKTKQKLEDEWGYVVITTYPDGTIDKSYTFIGSYVYVIAYLFVKLLLLGFFVYVGIVVIKRLRR